MVNYAAAVFGGARPCSNSSCCRCTLWPLLPNLAMLGNLRGWQQLYGVATSNLVRGADPGTCSTAAYS
jgi:hypothetical protein